MRKAIVASAFMAMALWGCSRDTPPPERPSPGSMPKPKVALSSPHPDSEGDRATLAQHWSRASAPDTGLFNAPGALPAAEKHFELFEQMTRDRAAMVRASVDRQGRTARN